MNAFKTNIVKSIKLDRTTPSFILFAVVYIIATLFVFTPGVFGFDRNSEPLWIKVFSLIVYLLGLFLMMRKSFYKPNVAGEIIIDSSSINIVYNKNHDIIPIKEVKKVSIDYYGTPNFLTTFFGNNNFILIGFNDSKKDLEYEIIIKSKSEKNNLKEILQSIENQGIEVDINIIGMPLFKRF